jgi:membrane associated rhomboid family serine protease
MAECSECGKKSMGFTCKYCGESFCSEHRLPENHDCPGLEEGVEEEKEENEKWFKDKDLKEEKTPKRPEPPTNSLTDDIVETFLGSTTLTIIGITVIFFAIQRLVPGAESFMILDPALSSEGVLGSPWSLFTVMLVHGSLLHLFANMVTFYFFGSAVENILDRMEMLKIYITSGLVASVAYVVFRNALVLVHGASMGGIETLGPAVGASGAVVAFVGMVGVLYPNAEVLLYFFIPMKLRTAVKAFAGLEIFNLVAKSLGFTLPIIGFFASSAHLAGLAVGIWYGRKIKDKVARSAVFNPLGY